MSTPDNEMWAKLRAPFPTSQIQRLPKPTSRDNQKGRCQECNGYHGLPAVHLDYVGHAEVTSRLLEVDPLWNWEPIALDAQGLPLFTMVGGKPVGLWIRLTVGGVSRLGFGSIEPGAFDPEKQLISDALRNAAMRFGVALDLWAKSDLHAGEYADTPPPRRTGLAATARALGATPAKDGGLPPESGQAPVLEGDAYQYVTRLMGSERVTSAAIKAVLGEFSRQAVLDWLQAEPGRTPETLITAAQNHSRGGTVFE